MKVVINACFGGFSLSEAALLRLRELGVPEALEEKLHRECPKDEFSEIAARLGESYGRNVHRNDVRLVQAVEELGDKAGGRCAKLKVIEIPDGIDWEVDEYDGFEKVVEKHRSWG